MAVNLSPVGGVAAQFFDNSGNVLTGGKLYTYAAGTTTPQITYTTSAGNVAWSNPIILDAAGRVSGSGEIWLIDGSQYKFILRDSNDVLIATYDNINGINSNFVNFTNNQEIQTATAGQTVFTLTTMQYQPGTNSLSVFVDGVNQYGPGAQYAYVETNQSTITFVSGLHVGASVKFTTSQINGTAATDAEQVSYNPPFTNAVPTNVEAKLAQTISVKDFGAVGDSTGTGIGTDDTAAIQKAYDYAASVGGAKIVWPTAGYRVDGTIYFAGNTETDLMRSNIYADNQTLFETGYLSGGTVVSNVATPIGDYSTAVFKSSIGNGTIHNPSLVFRLNKSLADTLYHDIEVRNYTGVNDTQVVNATECFFSNFKRFKYFGFTDGYVTGTANTTSGSSTITVANSTAAQLSATWIIRNHFTADILPTEITIVSVGAPDSGGVGLTNVVISQNANFTVAAGGINSGFVASKPNYVPMWKFDTANSNIVMEKVSGVARFVAFDLTDFNSSTIISPDIESGVAVGFRMKNCVATTITGMYTEAIYHTLFDVSQGGCYLDIGPGNYFLVAGSITAGASGSVSGSMIMADTMTAYTPYGFSSAGTPIINLSSANAGMNIIGGPSDIKLQNPTSKSRYLGQYGLALSNTASSNPTTLDWYQEGTWTPVIEGSSTAGTGTYTLQYGTYTRIGNRVYYTFNVTWSAHTGTGRLMLANLPFITTILTPRSFPVNVSGVAGSQFYFLTGGTGWLKPDLIAVDATGATSNVNIYASGNIVGVGHYEV